MNSTVHSSRFDFFKNDQCSWQSSPLLTLRQRHSDKSRNDKRGSGRGKRKTEWHRQTDKQTQPQTRPTSSISWMQGSMTRESATKVKEAGKKKRGVTIRDIGQREAMRQEDVGASNRVRIEDDRLWRLRFPHVSQTVTSINLFSFLNSISEE